MGPIGPTGPQGRKGEKVTADLINKGVVELLIICLAQLKKNYLFFRVRVLMGSQVLQAGKENLVIE